MRGRKAHAQTLSINEICALGLRWVKDSATFVVDRRLQRAISSRGTKTMPVAGNMCSMIDLAARLAMSALVVCLAFALAPTAPAHADAALIARGRAIAKHNCARCHAIGRVGVSANPKSPPFRNLSGRYKLESLEEALAEGIMVGHEGMEMPHFQLSPAQIDALLSYIASVQAK